jgi:hypothetical protein
MADKKITQLPSLSFISGSTTGYYAGEVVLPIVHNSTTVKIEAQKFALYATQWSATTASNTFIGNQTVNGNVVITGKLTAQEMHTEITSASIIFESGSTLFGNTADDTHTFTGTININGKVVGNAPLDFTSQSLNVQTGSQELINLRISSVTGSMNTQSSSQDSVNYRNSTVTSSLNFATASLNFTTGALNIATGSYNRFYQSTASIQLTTASLNQATSSLNFASGALNIATGSYNRFYDMTSSVHFTTQSLNVQTGSQESINVQNSTVTSSLNFASASINFTTGALNSFTGSIISQTNTIATFTSSVNFATSSLNTQTGSQDLVNLRISSTTGSINNTTSSFDSVFLRISSVTGSMNTQSSSQDLVNYQNSIVTSSFRNEIGGIEAYTASLKSAIIVNGSSVRIIGELTASRIYTEFITSSVLFVTGSNIIGDQSTDKHEFTGSVHIKDTLFIKGIAQGTGELNAQTASQQNVNGQIGIATGSLNAFTGSQINKDFTLSVVTSSLNSTTASLIGITNGLMALTASMKSQAIVSSSTQIQNYDVFALNSNLYSGTGSIKGEIAGIEAYTASLKAQTIVSSSTQVQNYDIFALNSNLYTSTGSLIGITNGLMALTASMKAAAIVSSSQQIQNYFTFAKTGSANTFYGTQTITGSLNVGVGTSDNTAGDLFVDTANKTVYVGRQSSTSGDNTIFAVRNRVSSLNALYVDAGGNGKVEMTGSLEVTRGVKLGTATGNVEVVGNLVMSTAGNGIDFSAGANAAGMTSELLNDYEEGTWTPTFGGASSDPTGVTYDGQSGVYTKIGRLVTATFFMGFTTYTGGSGALYVRGLPFAASGTLGYNGAVQTEQITFSGGRTYAAIRVSGGGSVIDVQQMGGATTWTSFIIGTEITSSGTGKYIQGTITYTAS